jgi:hypothetical protein
MVLHLFKEAHNFIWQHTYAVVIVNEVSLLIVACFIFFLPDKKFESDFWFLLKDLLSVG